MLKLIGMLTLITTGSFLGFSKSKQLSNRVEFLEQYIRLLSYIETQIRYSSECLVDLLMSCEMDEKFSFINCCLDKVANGVSFSKAWYYGVQKIPKETGLKCEDINLIANFGKGLGTSDIDGQVSHCELYKNLISENLSDARIQKQKKYKLYQMLGVCSGICAGLFLI